VHVTYASSLTVFKQQLKLHRFRFSFLGLYPSMTSCSVCCHLGHYKHFDWLIVGTEMHFTVMPPVATSFESHSHDSLQQNVHRVEMQIHADSNGKVALDDITLWANRCTKWHGNAVSRFYLIVHYVGGDQFFTGNYILWHLLHYV